jgi:phospholipase/lecithinase/hemolysin
MKKFRVLMTAVAAASFLAACGGSDPGNQTSRVSFTRMVNFGDSLSDVGSYKTQIVGGSGGGMYSINGNFTAAGLPYTNWTQYLAGTLALAQPCAAEVGLASVADLSFLAQTPAMNASCYDFAQGGARVTNPVGPGNAALYTTYGVTSGELGQLTVPLVTQVANFKAAGNTFTATDLVTVLAGGNDLFIDRGLSVDGTVATVIALEQAGSISVEQGNAQIAGAADAAVAAMAQAGTELAALIKNEIIAGGASHVVVVNLPDVSLTPDNTLWTTTGAGVVVEPLHPHLTLDMTTAFNNALQTGLFGANGTDSLPEVAWVDAFTQSEEQVTNPAPYGLTNLTTPACDLTKTGVTVPGIGLVPLASSLFCTKNSLIAPPADTVTTDDPTGVMHYLYADTVHPTPFGYRLLAQYVGLQMAIKGWL